MGAAFVNINTRYICPLFPPAYRNQGIPYMFNSPSLLFDLSGRHVTATLPAWGTGMARRMSLGDRLQNAISPRALSVFLTPAFIAMNKVHGFPAPLEAFLCCFYLLQMDGWAFSIRQAQTVRNLQRQQWIRSAAFRFLATVGLQPLEGREGGFRGQRGICRAPGRNGVRGSGWVVARSSSPVGLALLDLPPVPSFVYQLNHARPWSSSDSALSKKCWCNGLP